ncbi:MAG: HEAT repeat domain-containing protein [Planctomycetota bacterium]
MTISAKSLCASSLAVLFFLLPARALAFDKEDIDRKLGAIVHYDRGMDRQPLIAVEELIRQSQDKPGERKYIEVRLAELLGDATFEAKSFICKQLWFIGTAESVPAVARLLVDEKTADMACYAIGQNPSPQAAQALRESLGKTGPAVQIRIINVLGDRRDVPSVEAIGKLVFGQDRQVAEAALAALGKIGGERAREILARARVKGDSDLRFAATDAYLRCAEDLVAEGKREQAVEVYKELAEEGEASIIRSAAVKGLADAGGRDAVPLVIRALQDQDRMVRSTARGCVRTMQGEGVTELFAAELQKTSPDEQVLLIGSLADRGDPAALPAIVAGANGADAGVRMAALSAIGRLGDSSHVDLLVQVAAKDIGSAEKSIALNSLTLLRGDRVDDAIVRNMQDSKPTMRSQLIEVLFDRNAVEAVPALLLEAANPDPKVRRAAFKALGRLAGEKDLPSLVGLLTNVQDESGGREAERAVAAVARKIADEDERDDVVGAALVGEKRVAVRCSLLRVLGGIANKEALETVAGSSKDDNAAVQDTAVRALAGWPDAAAAEVLLQIYCRTQSQTHRLLALRGFVRLLALPSSGRTPQESLGLCRQALSQAETAAERKLVLSGLANVADPKALEMLEPFLQAEAVRLEAGMAAIKIAGFIMKDCPEETRIAMNRLLAVSKDRDMRERAEAIIRQINEAEAAARKAEK